VGIELFAGVQFDRPSVDLKALAAVFKELRAAY
jgi:hypothetical protein